MTRAQEAEENYVIKRELAVVRQQCSSAAEDLQKARSTIRQLQEQQVPGRWGPAPQPPGLPDPPGYFLAGRVGGTEKAGGDAAPPTAPHPRPTRR